MSGLLCIDVGTSSIKGAVIEKDGGLLRWAKYNLFSSLSESEGLNWNADSWITGIKVLISDLGWSEGFDGVIVSGNGPTVVPVDKNGEPLFEVLSWQDGRVEEIKSTSSFFLPGILWFKKKHPDLYDKTKFFLPCSEYINFYLTGVAAAIVPDESFIPFLWTEDSIRKSEMNPELFPPFISVSEKIGKVRSKAGAYLGIDDSIPVFAGGPDFLLALLGTGTVLPGRTCDRAGTSEGINYCSKEKVIDSGLRTLPHVVKGLYNVSGLLPSSGRIFEWFREVTGQKGKSYDEIFAEISKARKDREGRFFYSGFAGKLLEKSEAALKNGDIRAELGRAVLEEIGFGVRSIVETLEDRKCRIDEITVSGGQAKNSVWNQMKSNILNKIILVPAIEDAELLGDACAGLKGMGYYNDLREASIDLVRIKKKYFPDTNKYRSYSERYDNYKDSRNR